MMTKRRVFCLLLAATLTAVGIEPVILRAQDPVQPVGCEFKTRWKDAFGGCPGCCDARQFSCPCVVR